MVGAPPARALRGCHDGRGVLMLSSSGSAARMGAGNIGRTESRGICRHNSGTERLGGYFPIRNSRTPDDFRAVSSRGPYLYEPHYPCASPLRSSRRLSASKSSAGI